MIHPCDRRTDGRTIAYTRYSIYAVARKNRAIPNVWQSFTGGKFVENKSTTARTEKMSLSTTKYSANQGFHRTSHFSNENGLYFTENVEGVKWWIRFVPRQSEIWFVLVSMNFYKKAQLSLTNPRDTKACKNCSNSCALQHCRWQYWSIFIRLAIVASKICEILRNSLKIQTYRVQGHPRSSILVSIESACATSY